MLAGSNLADIGLHKGGWLLLFDNHAVGCLLCGRVYFNSCRSATTLHKSDFELGMVEMWCVNREGVLHESPSSVLSPVVVLMASYEAINLSDAR